jgi:hypothetical protein
MRPRSSPKFTYYAAAILLLPLVALWRRDDPLFSPLWQSDAWFYLGYFRDLVNFKRDLFPGAYYGSRLSWILPGYLAHGILPPLFANAVLHLGVHTVATASLFRILRSTAGVRAAFLTAILFSAYPWFWCATGWDHVTGAAIAYLLLGMACLAVAADRPSRGWPLTLAGMSLTAAVVAHLILAAFVPLILLHYAGTVWARRAPLKPTLIHAATRLAAGFLAVTVPLCAINGFFIDGNFWFWSPSFRAAGAVMQNYRWAESIWFEHRLVPWLWLLVAATAAAVVSVCRWRSAVKHRDFAGLMASAQLLLALVFMAAMQLRGITLLGNYYYACYSFPFAFLVIGNSFWRAAENMQARTYVVACAAALVLAAAAWYDPASHPAGGPHWSAAGFGALVVSLALGKRPAGTFLAIAGFVVLMFASYDGTIRSAPLHATREQYSRVMNARARIEERRGDSSILFWYDRREPAYHEYFALNATYLADFARIGEHFPSGCPDRAGKRMIVVVSSWREGAAEIARSALDRCWSGTDLKAVIEDTFVGSQAPYPYTIALLSTETDYRVLRPLSVTFGPSSGKGSLQLAPNPTRDEPLPLNRWYSSPGASQSVTFEGIEVQTPAGRNAPAFTYPALEVPAAGRYRFVLRYSPRAGQFTFGALSADESRWLAADQSRHNWGKHGEELAFSLDLKQGDSVILRISNSNSKDRPSSFTIEDVVVYLPASAR